MFKVLQESKISFLLSTHFSYTIKNLCFTLSCISGSY